MLRGNCGALWIVLEKALEPDPHPALHHAEAPGETELLCWELPLGRGTIPSLVIPSRNSPSCALGSPWLGPPSSPALIPPMGPGGVPWVSHGCQCARGAAGNPPALQLLARVLQRLNKTVKLPR